ncbi:calcium-binding protein 39 [Protopterus annectens]|uniref:calcium-binding protein 39 n=1 Tax=Protopterus annectens TaxID=7888 RepID=UPI001CFAEE38|nr:calcium-binding protein 39 [Protopterus annectens]
MPFPFGKSHKSPADIVKNLKESMAVLEKQDISDKKAEKSRLVFHHCQSSPGFPNTFPGLLKTKHHFSPTVSSDDDLQLGDRIKDSRKMWSRRRSLEHGKDKMTVLSATEEVSKNLVAMKEILYGTNEKEPQTEAVAQLAQELYNSGLLSTLIADLQLIDFEKKLDLCYCFNGILPTQLRQRNPTTSYKCSHQDSLFILLKRYQTFQVALNCQMMLRDFLLLPQHRPLAKMLLNSEYVKDLYSYYRVSTFSVFMFFFFPFKDLLTRHKLLSAEFLEQHYDRFFSEYEKLLHSENYVTKRQSLKLLGELLLDRHNFTIMTKYISKPENLKLMMNLLRDKSRNIQFEAFHVFKVFVANPNKTQPILDILLKNQTKLIEFLSKFQNDRTEDEQFNDEKTYLVKQIRDLKKPAQQEA